MAAEETVEAIYRAAVAGDVGSVTGMLDEDPYLVITKCRGGTILTGAAREGRVGVVTLVLGRGADVNATNTFKETALHLAAREGHEEVVSTLLKHGADPSRREYLGRTALIFASRGHMGVVRLLLRSMRGRGLNLTDELGRTAMLVACMCGHADVLRALLLAGADHTIADNQGTTPLEMAQRGRPQCVAIFKWWGAEPQRAYALHKARALHDVAATHQQAPAAPVPAYLSPRVQGHKRLPTVQVRDTSSSGGPRTREAAKRGREEGGQEKEEEVCAMVGYVVEHMAAELYTELLAGLQ